MIAKFLINALACLAICGCQAHDSSYDFSIKPAWNHQIDGLRHFSLANGYNIWVQQGPLVTAEDIIEATYVTDNVGQPAVMITLDSAGASRMSRFTSGHVNQPLAVFVDDLLISAPKVESTLSKKFLVMGIGGKERVDAFIHRCKQHIASREQ